MTKFLNISTDNTLGGNSPSDDIVSSQKAIKGYVDTQDTNKLDKVSTANIVYATDSSGNQTTYTIASAATASTVAYRSTGGTLQVGTPTANAHATTKKYVDDNLATKQDTLVSGTNIKTINNQSILGSGNIDVSGAGSGYHPGILSWEWDDHLREDMSWLRGDTFSWHPGTTYSNAYQHLLSDYNNAANQITVAKDRLNNPNVVCTRNASQDAGGYYGWSYQVGNATQTLWTASASPFVGDTVYGLPDGDPTSAWTIVTVSGFGRDTVAGNTIDYRIGQDGHKITTDESTVAQLYATTGVAWYYVLDTTNTRFKLPRAKHAKYAATLGIVGTGIALGLTNGTVNGAIDGVSNYAVYGRQGGYGQSVGSVATGSPITNVLGVTTDPANSGIVAQQAEDTDQYKYLYFYVGEFTQTAIENTAGLNAELFNGKVDTGHEVIAFQVPTAANNYTWYRKYRDGWVEQGGVVTSAVTSPNTINLPVTMADANYTPIGLVQSEGNGTGGYTSEGWAERTTTSFKVYGHKASAGLTNAYSWMVFGMAA